MHQQLVVHELQRGRLLHNLALLDDTLDFGDKEGADTHCTVLACLPLCLAFHCKRTLFADQGIVAVIRVVRITCRGTAAIAEGSKVEF